MDSVIAAANFCARFDRPMWTPEPTIRFNELGKTYTVNTSPIDTPSIEMEPDVCYHKPLSFISIAEDIEDGSEVFYEIFTKEGKCIQVSKVVGKSIMDLYEADCRRKMGGFLNF
jgi:hypothetical protein